MVPYNFFNVCSVKYAIGILIGIALDSMDILMLIHLNHKDSICLHLFVLQFLSLVLYSFLSTGLLPPGLGLFLGILFFLLLCQMDFFPDFYF